MTLMAWLLQQSFRYDEIALRERGRYWDIWELILYIRTCARIPGFGYGQMMSTLRVFEEGHWLSDVETGALLYEIVPKPAWLDDVKKVVITPM
jgi:hypothetical protein